METFLPRGQFYLKENVTIEARNPDGSVHKVWEANAKGLEHFKKTGVWIHSPEYGQLVDKSQMSNLITNVGFASVAQRIGGIGSVNAFTYVAIGTGATAANVADTTLQTEITTGGGARSTVTPTSITTTVANDTLQLQKTFSFSASFALTELGILNAASAGQLLSRYVYSAVNVISGMQVTYTYSIAVS